MAIPEALYDDVRELTGWLDFREQAGCKLVPFLGDPFISCCRELWLTRLSVGLLDPSKDPRLMDITLIGRQVDARRKKAEYDEMKRRYENT